MVQGIPLTLANNVVHLQVKTLYGGLVGSYKVQSLAKFKQNRRKSFYFYV